MDRRDGLPAAAGHLVLVDDAFAGVTRAELVDRVAALLAADSVPIARERKGRQEHDDLRPSVLALAVCPPRSGAG